MRAIRLFDEFLRIGIVKKQSQDLSRADFLKIEAEKAYHALKEFLEKVSINSENASNFIKQCYDIIMEIIRAKMLTDGFNSSGQGAHEAEVAYLRRLDFSEPDVQFIDQIRYFRNGTVYYGTPIDAEYAKKVVEFTEKIYPKLNAFLK
jgi:hypothetical protein